MWFKRRKLAYESPAALAIFCMSASKSPQVFVFRSPACNCNVLRQRHGGLRESGRNPQSQRGGIAVTVTLIDKGGRGEYMSERRETRPGATTARQKGEAEDAKAKADEIGWGVHYRSHHPSCRLWLRGSGRTPARCRAWRWRPWQTHHSPTRCHALACGLNG